MGEFTWVMKAAEDSIVQASEYATGRIHKSKSLRICKSLVKTQAAEAGNFFNIFYILFKAC